MYSEKSQPKKELFLNGSWGSLLLYKVITNSLELNFRTLSFNEGRGKICEACRIGIYDSQCYEYQIIMR